MKDDRNQEIVRRYLLPTSICVIAKDYGVTRQRIGEIVKKAGVHRPRISTAIPGGPKSIRDAIAAGTRPDWRRPPGGKTLDIISLREADPSKSYKGIGKELGVKIGTVANALKRWRPDLLRDVAKGSKAPLATATNT